MVTEQFVMIPEVSLSPCLYVLCFLRESVFLSFTRVFKMCILHFFFHSTNRQGPFSDMLANQNPQYSYHKDRLTEDKGDKGGKGKQSV